MRVFGKINIIGLDNGYGNIKTANGIFPASVTCCEAEPAHAQDVLVYDGKYYVIGAGHREFTLDKVGNQDHYLLTLAGIGQELWCNQLTTAAVHLAVGLPLTWVGDQREQFRAYLSQNRHVDFNWRGIDYHVDLVGVDVYAQGYSAVIPELRKFTGANMLCDIGNGTMIVMAINDRKPVLEQCFTEKYGTYQCVLKAREALTRLCGRTVPDVTIEQVMREGTADVAPEYVQVIREAAADYAAEIMRKLREHEYDPKTMRLWIVGGGGCLIRNFGQYDPNRVTIIGDIHASAKGYEYLAERRLQLFGSQASAHGGGNRVAGGTHHEKHDGDENEYSGDDQQESGQYETEKPTGQTVFLGFRLRLRRCRRRGAFGHAMLLLGKTIEYG